VPDGVGALARLGHVAWREIAGIVLLAAYFIGLPILLGRTLLKNLRREAGFWRYGLAVFLLLFMLTLPLKMILRWAFDLSYIVAMPEYFLNF
jgi:hypothetical protein